MATTTDKIQLILEIGGQEKSMASLKDLRSAAKDLTKQLNNAEIGSKEFIEASQKLATVKARLEAVSQSVKEVGKEMTKAASGFKGFAGGVGESLIGLAPLGAAAMGAFAVDKLISFGQGAIAAFNEAENAAFGLHNAMVTLGGESEETFNQLLDQADLLEQVTIGFSAENIQDAQKALKVFGATGDEIQNLIPKILDYATVTNQDLASATNDIIAGFQGKTKALEKAGLAFDAGAVSTAAMSEQLDKFAGSATAALDVGANKTEIFSDKWGQFTEMVGGFLVDVGLVLLQWVLDLAAYFSGLYNAISPTITAIFDFFNGLGKSFPLLGRFFDAIKAAFMPILSIPKMLITATAGIQAFVQTAIDSWSGLKDAAVSIFGDLGSLLYTVFTDPLNIGKAIDKLKADFVNLGSNLGDTFAKNYDKAVKQYSFALPSSAEAGGKPLSGSRTFKQEDVTQNQKAEASKRVEIAKKEAEEVVKITKDKTEKVIEQEKKVTEEKEIDYQKLSQEANDANKKALEGADLQEDLANRVRIAKADAAILSAKTEDEILRAQIGKILTKKDIELQNVMLTAEEKRLIEIQSAQDIADIEKDLAEKKAKIRTDDLANEESVNQLRKDALISLAQQGLSALAEFSKIAADKQIGDAENVKDARLKKLEDEHKKGRISEAKYAKQKEAIEADAQSKIAAIKNEQAKKEKAVAIVQSIINTALAITSALTKDPTGILATIVGITGGIQTALIAAKPIPQYAKGGIARGASHQQGGIQMYDSLTGSQVGEMEGGEPYLILSRNTYGNNKGVIDHLLYNSMYKNGAPIFAKGGILSGSPMTTLPSSQGGDTSPIVAELQALRMEISMQKTELQAYITYQSIEESIDTVNNIRSKAKK